MPPRRGGHRGGHRPHHRPPHRPPHRPRPHRRPPHRPPLHTPPHHRPPHHRPPHQWPPLHRPPHHWPPLHRPPPHRPLPHRRRTKWLMIFGFTRIIQSGVTPLNPQYPSTSNTNQSYVTQEVVQPHAEEVQPYTEEVQPYTEEASSYTQEVIEPFAAPSAPPPYTVDPDPKQVSRMGEVSRFTRAEVATRNGRDHTAIWIIIRDNVYDVTNYINEHPGGGEPILEQAGKDATRDFDDVGHTIDAKTIMTKYKIGELVEEDKHYDAHGKKIKKKKVVSAPPEDGGGRSCLSIITCGLLG